MYEIIVDVHLASESVYDNYNSYSDAQKVLEELVNSETYDRNRLCIVTKWQGGNSI